MRRPLPLPLIILLAAVLAPPVSASESTEPSEISHTRCTREDFLDCLNGVTNSVTSTDMVRVLGDRISRRVHKAGAEGESIAAAGGAGAVYAAGDSGGGGIEWWMNYAHADQDSDFVNANFASLAYDANVDTGTFGVHYMFTERLLFGAAVGYEDQNVDTPFNGGGADADGIMITPYIAYLLSDHFSIDASAGYTGMEYKQLRIANNNGNLISATFDASRWFFNANLSGFTEYSGFQLGATVGFLRVAEEQDGYTESDGTNNCLRCRTVPERDVTLSQLSAGFDVSYPMQTIEPFGYVTYRNDLSRNTGRAAGGLPNVFGAVIPDDDDEFELGLGLRVSTDYNLSGAIEGSYIVGREAFDGWALSITGRYRF